MVLEFVGWLDAGAHISRAPLGERALRVVKKTLKGNLLGKTGYKKLGAARTRETGDEPGVGDPPEVLPTRLKPRTQATLDALVKDDDVVIITEQLQPKAGKQIPMNHGGKARRKKKEENRPEDPLESATRQEAEADVAAATGAVMGGGTQLAPGATIRERFTATLLTSLEEAIGVKGSRMDTPNGVTFAIRSSTGDGTVRAPHTVLVSLPDGHALPHSAALAIELDNGGLLVLDVVQSDIPMSELKALAFDAVQLMRLGNCFSVLVFVRANLGGIAQEMAESFTHDYDHHFGLDEDDLGSSVKFTALRNRVVTWLAAARASRGLSNPT